MHRTWNIKAPFPYVTFPRWSSGGRLCCHLGPSQIPSLHPPQHLPCLIQQRLDLLALGDRFAREPAVPARVVVSPLAAGSWRTAVHAAAPFAAQRRCAAGSTVAGFGAATPARPHGTGVGGVIAHARACRLAPAELCVPAPRPDVGASVTAVAPPLSGRITLACCVTLPTMAWPPSPTDTFCTVTGGSPLLRWRLSASIWAGNVRASLLSARAALSRRTLSFALANWWAHRIVIT